MGHNRRFLKVISIVQIVMSAIFLALGITDRYEVRIIFSSYLFAPCWIAALVLPAGIMGLILVNKSTPSSTLINALNSVSMTSAVVSGLTVNQYKWAVSRILNFNLFFMSTTGWHFADNDAPLKLTDHENTALAISSLIVIISTMEVALSVCAAWSTDSLYQQPQRNQISQARNVYINKFRDGQQPTYTAALPMSAHPASSYYALQ